MRDLDVDRSNSQPPSIEIADDKLDGSGVGEDDEDDPDSRGVRLCAKSTPASPNTFRDPGAPGGRLGPPGRLSPALFAKLGKCNSEPDMLVKKRPPDMSRSCHNGIVLCLQVQEEREQSSERERDNTGRQQERPGRRPDHYEAGTKSDSEDSSGSSSNSSSGGMIMIPEQGRGGNTAADRPPPPPEGLIVPRKILNPCMESADRQNLHRELLFNQRIGKNVLNQKSELQKALERHKDNQARKDIEMQKQEEKTPLERVIEERARKLESYEKGSLENESKSSSEKPEFLQVHARLRARMDSK